jgi:hypothetical protein
MYLTGQFFALFLVFDVIKVKSCFPVVRIASFLCLGHDCGVTLVLGIRLNYT